MSEIKKVKIEKIVPNHLRDLETYPWNETKVESLMRSIKYVGLWESVIARPVGDNFEIAFGHHRIEAAKRLGLTEAPLIIKDLGDKEMLEYMGRENGDDYASDFLTMLNTWEACINYHKNQSVTEKNEQIIILKPIEVARLLGWTAKQVSNKDGLGMSHTAIACSSAIKLINEGHMTREDFRDMTITQARTIAQRTVTRLKEIAELGKMSARPHEEIKRAQDTVVKGAKITARQVRDGEISSKEAVNSAVDVNAYKIAVEEKKKPSPLFAVFCTALANSINKLLNNDTVYDRLEKMLEHIPEIITEEDNKGVRRVVFELSELENRVVAYQKKLIPNKEKIIPFKKIEGTKND